MRKNRLLYTTCVLVLGGVLLSFCACGTAKYQVDYGGMKDYFEGAEDAYPAGTEVLVYFDLIATDTDYSVYLDEERIPFTYGPKGFEIRFTMPDHDVKLRVEGRNSMEKK